MKLRTLAVITLVLLGCGFASAQTPGTYTFWNSAFSLNYCDYLVITYNSGGIVAGYDDLTEPQVGCQLTQNAPVVGFAATTSKDGQPAHGKGAVIGDAIYDASCECSSGIQWTLWVSAKVNKECCDGHYGPYGWMGIAGTNSGAYFGDNYGYLSAGIYGEGYSSFGPEKGDVAGHPTIAGKVPEMPRK